MSGPGSAGVGVMPPVSRFLRRRSLPPGAVVETFGGLAVGTSFRFVYGEGALNAGINGGPEGRTVSEVVHTKRSPRTFFVGPGPAMGPTFETGAGAAVLAV